MTIRATSPLEHDPTTVGTHLEGREEGTAVFTTREGRLVSRVRRGHLSGEQTLRGQDRQVALPMTYEYSSSLVLVR